MLVEQQQRVVADRLEVAVAGAGFLSAVDRTLVGVLVEHHTFGAFSGQHDRPEARKPGSRRRAAIPMFLPAQQPKRRIRADAPGVVEILIVRHLFQPPNRVSF